MIEIEHEGKRWTPLRPICEDNGIAYRHRLGLVLKDKNLETARLVAPCRNGQQHHKMVCIPADKVDYVLTWERPKT